MTLEVYDLHRVHGSYSQRLTRSIMNSHVQMENYNKKPKVLNCLSENNDRPYTSGYFIKVFHEPGGFRCFLKNRA